MMRHCGLKMRWAMVWRGAALLALMMVCVPLETAFGLGTESNRQGNDLSIAIDTRWAGCSGGGYYPIRLRVTNLGPKRELLFRCREESGGQFPTVERRILIDQNATDQFTLSVPMVGDSGYLQFDVIERGGSLATFHQSVGLPESRSRSDDRPSLLVVSPSVVDCNQFEAAANWKLTFGATPASGGYYSGRSATSVDNAIIGGSMLPEQWIDYSGLDIIAIPMATFSTIKQDARTAILKWVETGGNLLVYNAEAAPAESPELLRLLKLSEGPAEAALWNSMDKASFQNQVEKIQASAATQSVTLGQVHREESDSEEDLQKIKNEKQAWVDGSAPFYNRDLMLGRISVFRGNPFPGSGVEWSAWMQNQGSNRLLWTERNGLCSRESHNEFYQFLPPGVGGVPIVAFLTLISLFSLGIGPVNYFLLARRKKLYLLLVTIPAVALITSVCLFAYTAVSDGFNTKVRIRSFTLLDQRNTTAVTITRMSMFAGLSPSSGLTFSPETAIYPVWSSETRTSTGSIDWTKGQHLSPTWLPSRTMTQFVTVTNEPQRERVTIRPGAAGQLEVENGLRDNIIEMLIVDGDKKLYSVKALPAGAKTTAIEVPENSQLTSFEALVNSDELREPDGFTRSYDYRSMARMYRTSNNKQVIFGSGAMERRLQQVRSATSESQARRLPAQTFLAVLEGTGSLELGVHSPEILRSVRVIQGDY